MVDEGVGSDTAGQPDVAAHHAVMPHHCVTTQHGGVGVDHHPVPDGGVALGAARVLGDAQGPQGDPLVELDIVANHRGLPHHDPGPVVDAERSTDRGAGMDIDPGPGVRHLGKQPREHGEALMVKVVSNPVGSHGQESGIGGDDLVETLRGRIPRQDRLRVPGHLLADHRQRGEQLPGDHAPSALIHHPPHQFAQPDLKVLKTGQDIPAVADDR